jgi:Tfp pilus assembly protein PilF
MISQPPPASTIALRRRAIRFIKRGDSRKALMALREAAAQDQSGPSYVRLAHLQLAMGRNDEALQSLKQALFSFRHEELRGRARTVARMILKLDPADRGALRKAA